MIFNRKSFYYLRLFLDLFLVNISFLLAAILAQPIHILPERNYMFVLMVLQNFLWYFESNVINFYEDFSERYFAYQFINILKHIVLQALLAVLFIFLVKEDLYTRNFILFYSVILTILVSARILILRSFLIRARERGKNLRNVLIIGAGEIGTNFRQMINKHEDLAYNLVGFLDDHEQNSESLPVLGKINDLEGVIDKNKIEIVVIALPIYASNQLEEIIRICNKLAVRVYIIPDYFKFVSNKFQISMVGDFPIISVRTEPLAEANWRFFKRIFDIIFSVIVLVVILSWMIPLIFIFDLIFSRGPVLYKQDRVGANDEVFKCYKFRTMHVKNNSENNYQPAIEDDPRVTKVGKLLRKSNLDELPQFINVLKGQMSIVGPRPHPIPFNEIYKQMVEEIKIRNWVKPGITGWAQVHGYRGDVLDYEENKIRTQKRIDYDLWYIENWSFWLDIQIIILTIWQMIKGETKAV